jgi:hypothetical protein
MTLSWQPESLRAGVFTLRDANTHGTLLTVDMRAQGSALLADTTIRSVEISECSIREVTIAHAGGWNLISLPLEIADRRKGTLFPYSSSSAFIYDRGYVPVDTLPAGPGFWIKTEQSVIGGCVKNTDTMHLNYGWNIIGSIDSPVPVSQLVVEPDTIIASSFFGYGNGYSIADTIKPGSGYWVKSKSPGAIILTSSAAAPTHNRHAPPAEVSELEGPSPSSSLHTLRVSDEEGHAQSLFFGTEKNAASEYSWEMPPAPPGGFDAHFIPDEIARIFSKDPQNSAEYPIFVSPTVKQIFFSWGVENEENLTYILVEKAGGKSFPRQVLSGTGTISVRRLDQSSFTLLVEKKLVQAEIPREFSLDNLYPNPFNPTTHIRYSLPVNARVTIKVYTLLGQEVQTLVDDMEEAGVHPAEWNAAGGVASGMYFVRLEASPIGSSPKGSGAGNSGAPFVAVQKVMLVK